MALLRWVAAPCDRSHNISSSTLMITLCRGVTKHRTTCTAYKARWNIVKTSRRWCLGFNWISSKISRKRLIGEGENWRRGETSSHPPCTSTRSAVRAVYAVRCFVTSHYVVNFISGAGLFHVTTPHLCISYEGLQMTQVPCPATLGLRGLYHQTSAVLRRVLATFQQLTPGL